MITTSRSTEHSRDGGALVGAVRPGAMVAGEAIVVLPELPAEPHRATDMHDREGSGVDGDVYRFDIEGGTLEWAIPRGSVQCVREWLEPHT